MRIKHLENWRKKQEHVMSSWIIIKFHFDLCVSSCCSRSLMQMFAATEDTQRNMKTKQKQIDSRYLEAVNQSE